MLLTNIPYSYTRYSQAGANLGLQSTQGQQVLQDLQPLQPQLQENVAASHVLEQAWKPPHSVSFTQIFLLRHYFL